MRGARARARTHTHTHTHTHAHTHTNRMIKEGVVGEERRGRNAVLSSCLSHLTYIIAV